MQLLIDIFRWFLHGSNSSTEKAVAEAEPRETGPTEREHLKRPRKNGHIDFDLEKGANLAHFMEDMKSIEPISKQFSRAREELLEELKKLTPKKGRASK